MIESTNEPKIIRVLSGINSINFWKGYDPKTQIFDKTKTSMEDTEFIYCFSDGDGKRPSLGIGDNVTETILDFTISPYFFRRGERYIMSGLVNESDLYGANFSSAVKEKLKIDKLWKFQNWFGNKRFLDISSRL